MSDLPPVRGRLTPDRPLADLLGIPACACHDSILSNYGVSGNPGAVQRAGSVQLAFVLPSKQQLPSVELISIYWRMG
mgnify:CR=1 FL=1